MATSWPLIKVVLPPIPQTPANDILKLIFAPAGLDIAEVRAVDQLPGENESRNNAPGVQFTVTFDVAVSLPVTADKVPKFMSDTCKLQP